MSWCKTLRGIALAGLSGLVLLEVLGFVIAARQGGGTVPHPCGPRIVAPGGAGCRL